MALLVDGKPSAGYDNHESGQQISGSIPEHRTNFILSITDGGQV
jgi:hypothetical protein